MGGLICNECCRTMIPTGLTNDDRGYVLEVTCPGCRKRIVLKEVEE